MEWEAGKGFMGGSFRQAPDEPAQRIPTRVGVGKQVAVIRRGLEAPREQFRSLIDAIGPELLHSDCVSLHPHGYPTWGSIKQKAGSGWLAIRPFGHLLEDPGVAVRVGDLGE